MIGNLFSSNNLISQGAATTAAGTSDVNGTVLDMQGYEGVCWVAKFGTPATDNTVHAQQDTASGFSGGTDLLGTSVTTAASDDIVWLEIYQPRERFVRVVVDRGTSSTLDWCVAIQYGARVVPVDNTVAGTIAGEAHVAPAEGTA